MKRSIALYPFPWTSQRSRTAGAVAQYVPKNGTTPSIAARAKKKWGLELERKYNIGN